MWATLLEEDEDRLEPFSPLKPSQPDKGLSHRVQSPRVGTHSSPPSPKASMEAPLDVFGTPDAGSADVVVLEVVRNVGRLPDSCLPVCVVLCRKASMRTNVCEVLPSFASISTCFCRGGP